MKNYKLFFIGTVVFALIAAAIFAYGYNNVNRMVNVAVAGTDIHPDETATPQNVVLGKTPRGALQSDTILKPSELANMCAKGYIPAGTILRKSMFQPVAKAGIPAKLAAMKGRVALAIPSDIETTVGETIRPGDAVDIMASVKGQTVKVGTDVTVLAVPREESKAVVLAVTPKEADNILSAQSDGKSIALLLLPVNES